MKPEKQCKIIIHDEVYCTVYGLWQEHLDFLYKKYSILIANHWFNPKVKFGGWDGLVHFFQLSGKTYVKLLPEIVPVIISFGYKIQLDDRRDSLVVEPELVTENFLSHIINPVTQEPWVLRPYQVEIVNTLLQNAGGIALVSTGAGKTCVAACLVKAYELAGNLRSIIIVPDKNLTTQTFNNYNMFELDVGQYSGTNKDLNHQHIVSTWQSLQNVPEVIQDFQVLVTDECHSAKSPVLRKIVNDYGGKIPYRFGLTATLPKDQVDFMAVKTALGNVVYELPAHKLIDQGVLASIHINIVQHDIDMKQQYAAFLQESPTNKQTYRQFKDKYFPEWTHEKQFLQTCKTRIEWLANFLDEQRNNKKGNTLCLVSGINFGKKLSHLIKECYFLYGGDSVKERQQVYELFKTHDNILLIATINIAGQGLDLPRIHNLVCIDLSKSYFRAIQSLGRCMRKAPGKDSANIWDICTDLKYSRSHLTKRIQYYKEQKYPFSKQIISLEKDNTLVNI